MRLFRTVLSIIFVTSIALLYVHQQIELVKLSYSIDAKQDRLKDALDRNEHLGYNINNLEAPSRLEQVLISKKIDISFPKRANVIKSARLRGGYRPEGRVSVIGVEKRSVLSGIFDFFSPRAEAQVRER